MAIKFVSLVSEDNQNLSMGRVAFWILLIACFVYWFAMPTKPFPPTMYEVTLFVLLYNFGGKSLNIATDWVKGKLGMATKEADQPTISEVK